MQRLEEGILAAPSTLSPTSCYVCAVPLWRLECHGAGKPHLSSGGSGRACELEASMAHLGGC